MASEVFIEKSNGQVGTIEVNNKERLSKWDLAITERYKHFDVNNNGINIEWVSNNDKELKVKISTPNIRVKCRQSYTLTVYRGENAKTIMIQSKSVLPWKNFELPNLKELVNGTEYDQITWNVDWILKDNETNDTPGSGLEQKDSPNKIISSSPKLTSKLKDALHMKAEKSILKFNSDNEIDNQRLLKNIDALECKVAKLERDKDNLQTDLKASNERIKELQNKVNKLSSNDLSNKNKTTINSCQNEITKIQECLAKLESKIDSTALHPEAVSNMNAEIFILKEEFESHKQMIDKSLSAALADCRSMSSNISQYIDGRFSRLINNQIEPNNIKISEIEHAIQQLQINHDKAINIIQQIKDQPVPTPFKSINAPTYGNK